MQSGKSGTNRESNQASGVRVVLHVCTKKVNFVSRNRLRKISSLACRFSPIKIHFSDYPKSLISRTNEVNVFFNIY